MVITDIEKAIVERLRKGMGRMAKNVRSYGGELDGEPAEVLRQLPAVWVTFGGVQKNRAIQHSTATVCDPRSFCRGGWRAQPAQ